MVDTALNDARFLNRVQLAFNPEDMTAARLEEWILHINPNGKPKGSISNPSYSLAVNLAEVSKVYNKVEDYKGDYEDIDAIIKDAQELPVHSSTVSIKAKSKKEALRVEYLKEQGKTVTVYRDELKKATSVSEIDSILGNARSDLGEGKNYNTLVESADYLKRKLV